jgi:uncharacterized membrane protein
MNKLLDTACIGATFLLNILYNMILIIMSVYKPHRVRHTLNQAARRAWTLDVMRTGRDILAVQTLRNSMMAATLLASTSLTLSSLVAAYLYRIGDDAGLWNISDQKPFMHPVFKLFILLCSFMVSFFSFMQCLRSASTASFLIGLRREIAECCPERVADIVQRSAMFYSIGSRSFIFSFVLLLWIFGSPAALAGAIIGIVVHTINDFVLVTRVNENPVPHLEEGEASNLSKC